MATNASENSLHLWRSKAIDAFAQAEAVVDVLVLKLNAPVKTDMLGQKIEAARKAKHNSAVVEDRKKKIDHLLMELSALLALRNDIVHSPMGVEKVGDNVFAIFANPNVKCSYSSFRRIIPAPRLQALATKVTNLAKSLEAA